MNWDKSFQRLQLKARTISVVVLGVCLLPAFQASAEKPVRVVITEGQTWTPPVGVTELRRVIVVGGGGAGGKAADGSFGAAGQQAPGGALGGSGWGAGGGGGVGAGGGQAGQVVEYANVPVSGPVTVEIGKGATTANGAGGATCFGTYCAEGGVGGGDRVNYTAAGGGQSGWGGADGSGNYTGPAQNFGDVPIGRASTTRSVTVTNNSGSPVSYQTLSVASPFTKTADTCSSQTLAPNANCTLSFQVGVTALGLVQKSAELRSNRGLLTIPLTATGVKSELVLVAATPTGTSGGEGFYFGFSNVRFAGGNAPYTATLYVNNSAAYSASATEGSTFNALAYAYRWYNNASYRLEITDSSSPQQKAIAYGGSNLAVYYGPTCSITLSNYYPRHSIDTVTQYASCDSNPAPTNISWYWRERDSKTGAYLTEWGLFANGYSFQSGVLKQDVVYEVRIVPLRDYKRMHTLIFLLECFRPTRTQSLRISRGGLADTA